MPETPTRLLVAAHVPPPLHGQSLMVQQLLDALERQGLPRLDQDDRDGSGYIHLDLRFSDSLSDIGKGQLRKFTQIRRFQKTIRELQVAHRLNAVYYVPAPPKTSAAVRDALLVPTLRKCFPRLILHWHALGLGEWSGSGSRKFLLAPLLQRAYRGHDESIPLLPFNATDAGTFSPTQTTVIPNGIGDAFAEDGEAVIAERHGRWQQRQENPESAARLLFLSNLIPEKGVVAAIEAASRIAQEGRPIHLTLAGRSPGGEADQVVATAIEANAHPKLTIEAVGFVDAPAKKALLREVDALLFPTVYAAESFGLVVIEALQAGLPVVINRWRGVPDLLASDYPHVVDPGDVSALAHETKAALDRNDFADLRAYYLSHYTLPVWEQRMIDCLFPERAEKA